MALRLTYPTKDANSETDSVRKFFDGEANEIKNVIDDHADRIEELEASQPASENPYYGRFTSLVLLQAAHPVGVENAFALIDAGVGTTPQVAAWDDEEEIWELAGYVNNLVSVSNYSALPPTGAADTLYITLDTMNAYLYVSVAYRLVSPSSVLGYNRFTVKSKSTSAFTSSAPGEINMRYSGDYITELTFNASFSKYIADGIIHTASQKIKIINTTQEIISKAVVSDFEYTDGTDTYYKCLVDEGIPHANINDGDFIYIDFDEIIDGEGSGDMLSTNNLSDVASVATARANLEVESTSQLNTRDTNNRNRANHIGTQLASTISDFASAVVSAAASTYQAILTATNFGAFIVGLTSKTTPVDADSISVVDSEASNVQKKVSLTNFKAFLNTYFDTLYQAKPVFTADTGTVISLAYTAGNVCNTGTANTNGTFTLTGTVSGGNAVVLINRATEPTVTGATLIKGSTFIASTNMYLKVWNNSTRNEYWFEQIAP